MSLRNSSGWYKAWENDFYQIDGRGSPGHKEYRIKDKNTGDFITKERCSNYRFCVEMCQFLTKQIDTKVESIILGGEDANDK